MLGHRSVFVSRLPRIEWHDDDAFGHQREIDGYPANRVRREKRRAITWLETVAPQIPPHTLHQVQQFAARHADELLATNLAQNDAIGAAAELSENILEEIGHGFRKKGMLRALQRTSPVFHRAADPAMECCAIAAAS